MLDKQLGAHPVGVGQTWRRIFDLCVLKFTAPESTSACQDDQICARLKAGIYGTVHGIQDIWDTKLTTKYWGFLLVYTKNAFNDMNRILMLWTVNHLWPYGYRFISTAVVSGH